MSFSNAIFVRDGHPGAPSCVVLDRSEASVLVTRADVLDVPLLPRQCHDAPGSARDSGESVRGLAASAAALSLGHKFTATHVATTSSVDTLYPAVVASAVASVAAAVPRSGTDEGPAPAALIVLYGAEQAGKRTLLGRFAESCLSQLLTVSNGRFSIEVSVAELGAQGAHGGARDVAAEAVSPKVVVAGGGRNGPHSSSNNNDAPIVRTVEEAARIVVRQPRNLQQLLSACRLLLERRQMDATLRPPCTTHELLTFHLTSTTTPSHRIPDLHATSRIHFVRLASCDAVSPVSQSTSPTRVFASRVTNSVASATTNDKQLHRRTTSPPSSRSREATSSYSDANHHRVVRSPSPATARFITANGKAAAVELLAFTSLLEEMFSTERRFPRGLYRGRALERSVPSAEQSAVSDMSTAATRMVVRRLPSAVAVRRSRVGRYLEPDLLPPTIASSGGPRHVGGGSEENDIVNALHCCIIGLVHSDVRHYVETMQACRFATVRTFAPRGRRDSSPTVVGVLSNKAMDHDHATAATTTSRRSATEPPLRCAVPAFAALGLASSSSAANHDHHDDDHDVHARAPLARRAVIDPSSFAPKAGHEPRDIVAHNVSNHSNHNNTNTSVMLSPDSTTDAQPIGRQDADRDPDGEASDIGSSSDGNHDCVAVAPQNGRSSRIDAEITTNELLEKRFRRPPTDMDYIYASDVDANASRGDDGIDEVDDGLSAPHRITGRSSSPIARDSRLHGGSAGKRIASSLVARASQTAYGEAVIGGPHATSPPSDADEELDRLRDDAAATANFLKEALSAALADDDDGAMDDAVRAAEGEGLPALASVCLRRILSQMTLIKRERDAATRKLSKVVQRVDRFAQLVELTNEPSGL